MTLNEKNILVIGMAKSGVSAAKFCAKENASVTIYDGKNEEQLKDTIETLEDNIKLMLGEFKEIILDSTDLIIISPGVPLDLPFITKAKALSITIWSEVELAFRYCKAPIVAITGTNGKTTTTSLVGEIVREYYDKSYVVGNIGIPFTEVVHDISSNDMVVAEISSFQLETIDTFSPKVSSILNITPDHLNRHKTFENYFKAKLRITENQTENDYCVLNFDDKTCKDLAKEIPSNIVFFSRKTKVNKGVYLQEKVIYSNIKGVEELVVDLNNVKLLGDHMVENYMAAIGMAICIDIPLHIIRRVVEAFNGVEHRIEYVTTIGGVKYYNDSKATNPDAAIKGIQSMITDTVLIGGGMDKGNDFTEWIMSFDNKVKKLVVFGETSDKIFETANKNNFTNVTKVNTLKEAVEEAYNIANPGDSVLLSPACASWDMFESYEERGNLFKQYVVSLGE